MAIDILSLNLTDSLKLIAYVYLTYLILNEQKRQFLRIDWKVVRDVVLAIASMMILRYSLPFKFDNQTIAGISPFYILSVFWEDLIFAVPFAILMKKEDFRKYEKGLLTTLFFMMSAFFGYSHGYQGVFAIIVMSFAPALSIHYGNKFGFGTTMIIHVAWDLLVWIGLNYGGTVWKF